LSPLRFACVVGARPNFMKMAPILDALKQYQHVETVLVHSGQHYDQQLSDVFFEELGMRRPDVCLDVGSGRHGEQTARVLERFEAFLTAGAGSGGGFDRVIVVGDVNTTMAAALASVKLGVPVAHVEAGLRSFDRSMPEEINRIVTDSVSDMLFVSEPAGMDNLRREGHEEHDLHLVGNVMIDTLVRLLPRAQNNGTLSHYGLRPGAYGVVTLHRPSNVDDAANLSSLVGVLLEAARELPFVFPVHPRTQHRLERFGLSDRLRRAAGMILVPPLGYLDFLALSSQARLVITDSGGLQEESTVLGIPCLTMRAHTERPVTVEQGTSTLVGNDPRRLGMLIRTIIGNAYKQGSAPSLWDGKAAGRIAKVLAAGERPRSGGADTTSLRPAVTGNEHEVPRQGGGRRWD